MNWKLITRWFVVVIILLTAIYDIGALVFGGSDATISHMLGIEFSFASPLIPFAVGFVMGHLFWHQPPNALPETYVKK